ncbi:MAG TPA: hypothetical protein VER11_33365 [Polyangiaceae bacterium]|nr:hypothetical protein [Polyangiaceae bacterium]
MSSAVKVILGVSVLAMASGFAACDNGSGDTGPIVAAGSGNTGSGTAGAATGTGGASTGTAGAGPGTAGSSTGGGSTMMEGVPITPNMGWVAVDSNVLGIQGAAFSFADATSKMGMTDNLMTATDGKSCIVGTAAKVDMASDKCVNKTFDPPATDCYGQYWGAAFGINLNQTIDPGTMMGGTAMPFDASLIKGFYFEIDGNTVPGPTALRFKVDDGTKEYCNPSMVKVKVGPNTVLFSDLTTECWMPTDMSSKVTDDVKKKVVKIAWQVVTNASSTVPFDFCISNVRALLKDGAVVPMGTAGASSTGTAGASSGTAGASTGTAGASTGTAGASTGGSGSSTAGAGGTGG